VPRSFGGAGLIAPRLFSFSRVEKVGQTFLSVSAVVRATGKNACLTVR
jgi:hypothetical protein